MWVHCQYINYSEVGFSQLKHVAGMEIVIAFFHSLGSTMAAIKGKKALALYICVLIASRIAISTLTIYGTFS